MCTGQVYPADAYNSGIRSRCSLMSFGGKTERKGEREGEKKRERVCMCVRERDTERARERERVIGCLSFYTGVDGTIEIISVILPTHYSNPLMPVPHSNLCVYSSNKCNKLAMNLG